MDLKWHEVIADSAVVGLVVTAVAREMPKPDADFSFRTLYEWVYNSVQQILSMKGVPLAPQTVKPKDAEIPKV